MTTEQKLNKLTDLLIEWSESGMFLSDLNYRLKQLKTEEIKPDVTTSEGKEEKILKFKDMPNWNKLADKFNEPTPWLPNPGDGYYTIHLAFNEPAKFYWTSPVPTLGEMALLKLGLIFKTQEEAMAKINSLLNL